MYSSSSVIIFLVILITGGNPDRDSVGGTSGKEAKSKEKDQTANNPDGG